MIRSAVSIREIVPGAVVGITADDRVLVFRKEDYTAPVLRGGGRELPADAWDVLYHTVLGAPGVDAAKLTLYRGQAEAVVTDFVIPNNVMTTFISYFGRIGPINVQWDADQHVTDWVMQLDDEDPQNPDAFQY